MKTKANFILLTIMFLVYSSAAFAQPESGGIVVASATLGFQAKDETFHSPYLDGRLAGWGWGGAVAAFGERHRFVFGGEVSTVRYSRVLTGRLVSSFDASRSPIPTHYDFQDTFISGLVGGANTANTLHYLGGAGFTHGAPVSDEEGLPPWSPHWLVLTGGVDGLVPISAHAKFVIGVRYSYVFRAEHLRNFGVGHSAIRTNVGLAFGSN